MRRLIRYIITCPECNGEGAIHDYKCQICYGRGFIPARKLPDYSARKAWEEAFKKMG